MAATEEQEQEGAILAAVEEVAAESSLLADFCAVEMEPSR
jgi:hypothetical protein